MIFLLHQPCQMEVEPHEHVLNQRRSLDGERHNARAWLFMYQLNDAEAGNVGNMVPEQGDVGAIGDEPLSPPLPPVAVRQDPANVNIMNEYNSFNLANMTPPIAPKWKMSALFWMISASSNILASIYLMDQCAISLQARLKQACC